MKLIEKLGKDWAEYNSSPGIDGRTGLYEILIECQKQGYEAGFRNARHLSAIIVKNQVGVSHWEVEDTIEMINSLGEEEI